MNLFEINQDDIQSIFDMGGQTVLINNVECQAIITNPAISEYEERYLHTLENVQMGDIVTIDNEKYLIIAESNIKRGAKCKTKIRHCNFIIELPGETTKELIGYDDFGRPIYHDVEGEPILIPAIVENKTFTINGSQIVVAENQIVVMVQDNTVNEEKFVVNSEFGLMGKNWKVRNDDLTRKGLLILTCEFVSEV